MSQSKPGSTDLVRCPWAGIADAEYARYHDEEWGVPLVDDVRLFEKLALEGFQSGLSWLTILRKRDNFRRAFAGFEPKAVARFGEADIARLMDDAGIVRNRAKIEATIGNARAYLALTGSSPHGDVLARLISDAAGPLPPTPPRRTPADVPSQTDASLRISKALKAAGFRFVGPTTVYAFMQSTGMVNDHLIDCHRHATCETLQRSRRLR